MKRLRLTLYPFRRERERMSQPLSPEPTYAPQDRARSQAAYGDTSVRTLGALSAKIVECLQTTALYGLTRLQVRGLMLPNVSEDVDRCLYHLEEVGDMWRTTVAGTEYFFENTSEAHHRAKISLGKYGYVEQ